MSKKIGIDKLSLAIGEEFKLYTESIRKGINQATEAAGQELKRKTKATAPVGFRGKYKNAIDVKFETNAVGDKTATWYVKGHEYRLTHLLKNGHMKRGGTGRTKANPFLDNARDEVVQKYENDVREIIENG